MHNHEIEYAAKFGLPMDADYPYAFNANGIVHNETALCVGKEAPAPAPGPGGQGSTVGACGGQWGPTHGARGNGVCHCLTENVPLSKYSLQPGALNSSVFFETGLKNNESLLAAAIAARG